MQDDDSLCCNSARKQTKTLYQVSVTVPHPNLSAKNGTQKLDLKSDCGYKWCRVIRFGRSSKFCWKINLNIESNFKISSEDCTTFLWTSCSCSFGSFSEPSLEIILRRGAERQEPFPLAQADYCTDRLAEKSHNTQINNTPTRTCVENYAILAEDFRSAIMWIYS